MLSAHEFLRARLSEDTVQKLDGMILAQSPLDLEFLLTYLASVPRRFRGAPQTGATLKFNEILLESATYFERDLAGAWLLTHSDLFNSETGALEAGLALYMSGDAIERRMILKALPFIGHTALSQTLIMEGHRSNDQSLFEAAFCDTNHPAIVLEDDDYQNATLKAAFINIEASRLWGVESRVTTKLSQMLLDLRTEREAASRPPWTGTLQLMAHAPIVGLTDLIADDLIHDDIQRRLGAARAACVVRDDRLMSLLTEQLEGCEHAELKALLTAAL